MLTKKDFLKSTSNSHISSFFLIHKELKRGKRSYTTTGGTRKGGYLVIVTIYRVAFSLLFLLPKALERIYRKARRRMTCELYFLLPVREVIRFFPLLLCTGPLVLEFNWWEDTFKKQISWHCCNLCTSVSRMIGENWFGPSFPTAPQTGEPEGSKSLRDVLYHVTDCCSRLPELRQSGQVPYSCRNCFGPGEVIY